ncbi:MAG: FG-GAP-like repeat-containing protein [Fibrobacterota bacterium]
MRIKFISIIFLYLTSSYGLTIMDVTSSQLSGDMSNDGRYGGHGVMFADADKDGSPDFYITMNNSYYMPDLFFLNDGSGSFTESGNQRGIDNADDGSHGWTWADLDNDGDFDGWNGSYEKNIPYENRDSQPGYFNDRFSGSGIEDIQLGTRGVAAFDFDNDGDLDLFGNNWYARGAKENNEFYRNDGNFTFTRIDNGLKYAKGDQGVCDGDFDDDGDMDLLLCVFEDGSRCVEIWENNDGQFSKASNTGINLCVTVDGVTFWDMDNDGLLDVVSGYDIYLNDGDGTFTELSGVPSGMRVMRGIADLNNDGYWDLISPGADKVYLNNGDLTFSSVSFSRGTINDPRTVAFADIDGDGDVDWVLGQKKTYNRLYRNNYSGGNHYLFVELISPAGQAGAFGAKVYIYSAENDTLLLYRQAHSNHGYLAQDDPVLHFGCGQRESVRVKVRFLDGTEKTVITDTDTNITVDGSASVGTGDCPSVKQHAAGISVSPNPFNPSTVISLSGIPDEKNIELNIYDSRGRLAANLGRGSNLRAERMQGSVLQRYTWDAFGMPAGVYTLVVETGIKAALRQRRLIKKMVLVK